MSNNTDLRKFSNISSSDNELNKVKAIKKDTDNSESEFEKYYELDIEPEFMNTFDLTEFLQKYVLEGSFHSAETEQICIRGYDDLCNLILNKWKAKAYIGVGVGGVYIKNINQKEYDKEYVLLYKRYHEPENQLWSILGGSSKFGCNIEDTLKDKIAAIINVSRDTVIVKDIIKENNHQPGSGQPFFHYLSPSYYVEIENINSILTWKNESKRSVGKNKSYKGKNIGKKYVYIIDSIEQFADIEESKFDDIKLAWVAVDIINNEAVDSEDNPLFAFTALGALKRHRSIRNSTREIDNQLNTAISQIKNTSKVVTSYKDWRIKNEK